VAGIKSCGAYIPLWRLSRDTVSAAWGSRSLGGERSVANWDEDSLTMATEAAYNCINGLDRQCIGSVYFASTTAPYKEKQCAAVIASALDLSNEVFSVDFSSSLRAGTNALRSALEAARGGSAGDILIVASDARLGTPRTTDEQTFGDGAAAVLVGNSGVAVEVEDMYSVSADIADVWRKQSDTFVQSWEDRWVMTQGYTQHMKTAISGIMKKQGLSPKDVTKVILYSPDAKSHLDIARALGFDPKEQVQDTLISQAGNLGAAHTLAMLVAALQKAKPGDRLLVASYGDGSDAFILKVTENSKRLGATRGVEAHLESKRTLSTYEKYLAFRGLVAQPEEFIRDFPSASVMWRTRSWASSLHGSRCRQCGMVTFPIQRVCYGCQTRDEFEEVLLSDKMGKVFTYSLDNMAGSMDPPIVQTIVELDDGTRLYCLMTDCDPKSVEIGMPVEMTYRKFHEHGGFHNYYWKCRPTR